MGDLFKEQCRAARGLLGWSQSNLAEAAHVARQTVVDFERGARQPLANNIASMRAAFERAGAVLIDENGGGAGVRLAKLMKRKRSK
jgi:DNA-binding XRE family transcriptional regulator